MKAYILTIAAAAALCAPASAAEFAGGLKLGMNVSSLVGDISGSSGSRTVARSGVVFGGYMVFQPRELPFEIQAEGLITSKGGIIKYAATPASGAVAESRVRLTYLEIPVLARFNFEPHAGVKPSLLFGPSLGVKLASRVESLSLGGNVSGNDNDFNGMDFGVALGGLVEMETSRGSIVLEARYTRGLTSVYDGNSDVKNSAASVMVGYRF